MKSKLILVFIFVLLFSCTTYGVAQEQEFDFRRLYWGMSREQVLKAEGDNILAEKSNQICLMTTFFEMDTQVYFTFVCDKLVSAEYNIFFEYTEPEETEKSISLYTDLKKAYMNKYGAPNLLKDTLFEQYKDNITYWDVGKTKIRLVLMTGMLIQVTYSDTQRDDI